MENVAFSWTERTQSTKPQCLSCGTVRVPPTFLELAGIEKPWTITLGYPSWWALSQREEKQQLQQHQCGLSRKEILLNNFFSWIFYGFLPQIKHPLAYPFLEHCPFPDDTKLGHILGYMAGLLSAHALLLGADPDLCSQGKAKQHKTKAAGKASASGDPHSPPSLSRQTGVPVFPLHRYFFVAALRKENSASPTGEWQWNKSHLQNSFPDAASPQAKIPHGFVKWWQIIC